MKVHNLIFVLILGIFLLMLSTPSLIYAEENSNQTMRSAVDLYRLDELKAIQARYEEAILKVHGVVGMGIGLTEDGKDLGFVGYCKKLTTEIRAMVPRNVEGVPVRLIESGVFRAY